LTLADRKRLQASLRQRLLNIAQQEKVDFQVVLIRYGLERFLYRLGRSQHRESFLLKGAFLFHAWQNDVARPTRDVDLLGHGSPDIARLEVVVADIVGGEVGDDGLDFPLETIGGETIREASLHDGIRIKLVAKLGRTQIPLQLDVGFGDTAGRQAVELEYPTMLDQDPPLILAYKPQFVVAEKLEAMVVLGMINTRLKDYYDLWTLTRMMDIPSRDLVDAVRATFAQRGTSIPDAVPPALTDEYANDEQKRRMWTSFIERNGLDVGGASLASIVRDLRSYLVPLMAEAVRGG